MQRPPRARNESLLTPLLVWRIVIASILFVIGAFGIFFVAEIRGHDLPLARTMTVNTLVVMEIFYLFSVRYVHGTALTWRGKLGTRAVISGVVRGGMAQLLFKDGRGALGKRGKKYV